MFGPIGFPELMLIFVVVLLLFGPKKLPEFAKFLGKAIKEFRSTVNEAKSTIEEELENSEIAEDLKEIDRDLKDIKSSTKINLDDFDLLDDSPKKPVTSKPSQRKYEKKAK